jgi:HK97 family phage prohead protease
MTMENRTLEAEEIEIRSEGVEGEEQRYVQGVGIVYDKEVEIWPGFREKIRAGAFEKTLSAGVEIKSFFNHDASQVLATTKSTPPLELEETPTGLRFKAPIPPTTYGNDLRVNLERKNVRGASFSFSVDEKGEILTRDEKGVLHREIVKATIYEIGPVTNPAYRQTAVGLRSLEESYTECAAICDEQARAENADIASNELELKKLNLNLLNEEA